MSDIYPIAKPTIDADEIEAVHSVLSSGMLANGEQCPLFEEEFAAVIGAPNATAVNSGTTALTLALRMLISSHWKQGKLERNEVIVPAMSFNATSASVLLAGLYPVFVDIDDTGNINPSRVEEAITSRTAAIIAVDLYGRMADYESLNTLGIPIIEDAAQAHGASSPNGGPGSIQLFEAFGNLFATTFSFYATKNMTTGGEGGAVVMADDYFHVLRELRAYRDNGDVSRYDHRYLGGNFRLTEMQAAFGRAQVKSLKTWVEQRQENALTYNKFLGKWIEAPELVAGHAWHQYVIRLPTDRDKVMQYLRASGVGFAVHYPVADPRQRMYGYRAGSFPEAELLASEALSIPVGPWLTPRDIQEIADIVNRAVAS